MDAEESKKEEERKMDKAKADAEEKEEKAKADADAGEKLDKILACLDSIGKRCDALEMSAMDAAKSKKDAEEERMKEKGDPEELKADARMDSAEIRTELSEIQSDAERASSAWSKSAPHPWDHESPDAYRRRAAQFHKQHSSLWKEVDLRELSGQALKNATAQIFNDSYAMACSNEPYAGGDLREVRRVNRDTGHVIKEHYGSPSSWMAQFMMPRYRARFDMDAIKKSMRNG
jgi:hypothetical protein